MDFLSCASYNSTFFLLNGASFQNCDIPNLLPAPFCPKMGRNQNLMKNQFSLRIWLETSPISPQLRICVIEQLYPTTVCILETGGFFSSTSYLFIQNVMFCIKAGKSFELVHTEIDNSILLNEWVMCLTLHSLLFFQYSIFLV